MEKLYTSKTFFKMAGGRMHIPHPTPFYPPLAISYRNYQKSLAYFSHLAPLILFSSVAKRTLSVREVWGSILGPVKSAQSRQRLATVATFLRSCVSPGAKPRRWAPQLVTRFDVIRRVL